MGAHHPDVFNSLEAYAAMKAVIFECSSCPGHSIFCSSLMLLSSPSPSFFLTAEWLASCIARSIAGPIAYPASHRNIKQSFQTTGR